jgi:methanethiol S-methyltransferase
VILFPTDPIMDVRAAWPTLLMLLMFPVLVVIYVRLARIEEREALRKFGDQYRAYMQRVPAFLPRLGAGRSARVS